MTGTKIPVNVMCSSSVGITGTKIPVNVMCSSSVGITGTKDTSQCLVSSSVGMTGIKDTSQCDVFLTMIAMDYDGLPFIVHTVFFWRSTAYNGLSFIIHAVFVEVHGAQQIMIDYHLLFMLSLRRSMAYNGL